MPNYILLDWYNKKNSSVHYVDMINKSIVGQALMVMRCQTIEERIRVNECKLNKKLEGKSKRVKQSIKGRNTKITVYVDEVERPLELYEDLLYSIDDYRYYNL